MQPMDELLHIANQVESLEEQTLQITAGWYDFVPGDETQVRQVVNLTGETSQMLDTLSSKLDTELRKAQLSIDQRQRLQYAYNTVQELQQSREATQDMAFAIVADPSNFHQEYLRALALKEKAAAAQVDKLVNTLVQAYGK